MSQVSPDDSIDEKVVPKSMFLHSVVPGVY